MLYCYFFVKACWTEIDNVYLKTGKKQDIVFPRPILERNEIVPIPRSHTSLVPIVISARYLVQPYLIGFLVTQNREINGERTVTSRSSFTQTLLANFVSAYYLTTALQHGRHKEKKKKKLASSCFHYLSAKFALFWF